jgi:hypothetical protein
MGHSGEVARSTGKRNHAGNLANLRFWRNSAIQANKKAMPLAICVAATAFYSAVSDS